MPVKFKSRGYLDKMAYKPKCHAAFLYASNKTDDNSEKQSEKSKND